MSKAAELANLIGNINAGGGGVNRNLVINGAMNVSQRAVSSTGLGATDGYYTVDRFQLDFGNTAGRLTMTQDSSAPSGFANSMKLACTTADTSIAVNESLVVKHIIEGQNVQAFAKGTADAKPFAVSFYVKGNASATYVCALYDADNTRYIAKTFSVTTDWTRVEITFPADTTGAFDDDNAESLHLWIWLHAGSNFTSGTLATSWASYSNATTAAGGSSFFDSTSRTFFLTGVQLEVGQNPTEFEHEPIERTLAKCQRYFWNIQGINQPVGAGASWNDSYLHVNVAHPVEMRANPDFVITTGTNYYQTPNGSAGFETFNGDDDQQFVSTLGSIVQFNSGVSITAGRSISVSTANSSADLAWNSEL